MEVVNLILILLVIVSQLVLAAIIFDIKTELKKINQQIIMDKVERTPY